LFHAEYRFRHLLRQRCHCLSAAADAALLRCHAFSAERALAYVNDAAMLDMLPR